MDVLFVLLTAGFLYTLGWWRLRQLTAARWLVRRQAIAAARQPLATGRRLSAYWSGLILIALALMSPIDVFSSQLFIMHMIQHLLLVMLAPPLLWLANPFPFVLWGIPAPFRKQSGRFLAQSSPVRRVLKAATPPGLAWLAFVAIYWGWHDPNLYDAALRSDFVHDLEHLTFFGGAMLFWWRVTGATPQLHGKFSLAARAVYAISFVPPNMLAGMAIVFAGEPLYTYYTAVPRVWGISVMQDQQWGGFIMWVPGSMMYIVAALVLLFRLFQNDGQGPVVTPADWDHDGVMIAPGLEK